eukprot:389329-Pelagomonas_calceolata.AAC.8
MLQSHTHHVQAKVQALYATDQQWYNGTVEAVSASGNLLVNYEGYDETTELPLSSVRERPESAEIYMGVAAPKRKRVEEQQVITEIPKVRFVVQQHLPDAPGLLGFA